MPQQPLLDRRGLVRREVVQDDVHVEFLGQLPVDLVHENDEIGVRVALAEVGDDGAGGNLEGGEEIAGPIALVVVRGPLRRRGQHRQRRCGSVQGLDLGLLVDGEHRQRPAGSCTAPPGPDLLHQLGIGRDLEAIVAPGRGAEGPRNLGHRSGGSSRAWRRGPSSTSGWRLVALSEVSPPPPRSCRRRCCERQHRGAERPRGPLAAQRRSGFSPLRHGGGMHAQLGADRCWWRPERRPERSGTARQRLRGRVTPGPALQGLALVTTEADVDWSADHVRPWLAPSVAGSNSTERAVITKNS